MGLGQECIDHLNCHNKAEEFIIHYFWGKIPVCSKCSESYKLKTEETMTLYRYYITDACECCVFGTDDGQTALDFSHSDDHFVIDTKTGKQIVNNKDIDIEYIGD